MGTKAKAQKEGISSEADTAIVDPFRPERRRATLAVIALRQFGVVAENLESEQIQDVLSAFEEEVIRAAAEQGGIVTKTTGGEVLALFGAHQASPHHALRAVLMSCTLLPRLQALRTVLAGRDCRMPECNVGIHSGDLIISGAMSLDSGFEVIGTSVDISRRLCEAARGGRVLISEGTLELILAALPRSWSVLKSRDSEAPQDESSSALMLEDVFPLSDELQGRRIILGPDLGPQGEGYVLDLRYWQEIKIRALGLNYPAIAVDSKETELSRLEVDTTTTPDAGEEQIFGKFRLIRKLGEGGMGEVWLARDRFGNQTALKKLSPHHGSSPIQNKRFKREAEIMSRLHHRNICRIHEVGEVDGLSYIAMEYIEGVSLVDILCSPQVAGSFEASFSNREMELADVASLVKSIQMDQQAATPATEIYNAPASAQYAATEQNDEPEELLFRILPLSQTLSIFIKICHALQYAHEHGVLHRDLKPGNIMLRADGEPVLMDFGLAKLENPQTDLSLSISGQIMGTVDYMAPEQARSSKDVDERADVYGLGAILYQMITGRKHFNPSGTILEDANALQTHEPVPPIVHNKHIDKDLGLITIKALRPDPIERYRNVATFREDLERYSHGEPVSATPTTSLELITKLILRNRTIFIVSSSSLVALLVLAIWSYTQINQQVNFLQEANERARIQTDLAEAATRKAEEALTSEQSARKLAEEKRAEAENMRAAAEQAEQHAAKATSTAAAATADAQHKELQLAEVKQKLETGEVELREAQKSAAPALVTSARELAADFKWRDALDKLNEAIKRDPNLASAWLLRARVELAMLNFKDAMQDLSRGANLRTSSDRKEDDLLLHILERYSEIQDKAPGQTLPPDAYKAMRTQLEGFADFDTHVVAAYLSTVTPSEISARSRADSLPKD